MGKWNDKGICKNNFKISDILDHLKNTNQGIITNDKTNSFRSVSKNIFMTIVDEHFVNSAKIIDFYIKWDKYSR